MLNPSDSSLCYCEPDLLFTHVIGEVKINMPSNDALGFIETRGYVGAIEAADAALKSADVTLISTQKADAGLVTVILQGDVASVRAAVSAGSAAAKRVGELVSENVIARSAEGLEKLTQPAETRQRSSKAVK